MRDTAVADQVGAGLERDLHGSIVEVGPAGVQGAFLPPVQSCCPDAGSRPAATPRPHSGGCLTAPSYIKLIAFDQVDRGSPAAGPAAASSDHQPGATQATYRPSTWKATSRRAVIAISVAGLLPVALGFLYSFRTGGVAGLLLALTVLTIGVPVGVWFLYLRTLSVTVDAGGVTRRALGTTRRIQPGVLQRVVLVSYRPRSLSVREVPILALLDATGRSRLRLNLSIWAQADARSLVSHLGLMGRVTSLGHRAPRQLRREVPGALPWAMEHRVAANSILLGGLLMYVAGVLVILQLTGS